MKIYKYVGKNLSGQIVKGNFQANDVHEVLSYVRERGYYLLYLQQKNENIVSFFKKSKISNDVVSLFCNQFQITLQAGLTILRTLHILYLQCSDRLLKQNLHFIINEIKRGESLYNSLLKSPFKFPKFLCYMIKIGEESGKLSEVLKELSNYYYKENKLKKKITGSMIYPVIVLISTSIMVIGIMTKVIPSYASVLLSLDAQLPLTTKFIINLNDYISKNIIPCMISIVIMMCSSALCFKYNKNKLFSSNLLFRIPIFGRLYRSTVEIEFTKVIGILLNSGISIIRAMEIVQEITINRFMKHKLKDAINDIKKGYLLSESISNIEVFSEFTLALIKIGEENGSLDIMLEKSTTILEDNLECNINRLTELINPAMMIFIAIIVGVIIASVILPIFTIANAI